MGIREDYQTGKISTVNDLLDRAEAQEKLLLGLIGSLTLADHMGDVANDLYDVIRELKLPVGEWSELHELADELGKLGIETLHGTKLGDD